MSKKNTLGKIVTKKILAFAKTNDEDEYRTFVCTECNKEYLSQGIIDIENHFCPNHSDCYYCNGCGDMFNENELKEDSKDEELYCKECYTEYCKNCGDSIKKDDVYCSNECKNEFYRQN